jgi:hypothetical protein
MDRKHILDLVADMSLEEKAMQMTQLSPDLLYQLTPISRALCGCGSSATRRFGKLGRCWDRWERRF